MRYVTSPNKNPNVNEIVRRCFSEVDGKPCWGVYQGWGSSLFLEFGKPELEIIEPRVPAGRVTERARKNLGRRIVYPRGTWSLRIDCCEWELHLRDEPGVHNESPRNKIEKALRLLNGQILSKVTVNGREGSSTFTFDLGARLLTFPYDELTEDGEPYENWYFFLPRSRVLIYRADGKYAFHRSDRPVESKWLR